MPLRGPSSVVRDRPCNWAFNGDCIDIMDTGHILKVALFLPTGGAFLADGACVGYRSLDFS